MIMEERISLIQANNNIDKNYYGHRTPTDDNLFLDETIKNDGEGLGININHVSVNGIGVSEMSPVAASGESVVDQGEMVQYKKSHPVQSFINIVKTFAGAGTFGLPWALKQSGVLTGVIGIVVMALLANYTMSLLYKCRRFIQAQEEYSNTSDYWKTREIRQAIEITDPEEIVKRRMLEQSEDDNELEGGGKVKKYYKKAPRKKPLHLRIRFDGVPDESELAKLNAESAELDPNDYIYEKFRTFTYMDLGYEAMGEWGSGLVYFLLFLCNLGVCTVYLTMISEIMTSMVPHIPQRVWILFTIPIFVPLSWIRSYAFMTPVSILGTLSLLVALGSVIVYGFMERVSFMKAPWSFGFKYSFLNIESFTLFIGVVLFLFNTHTMVLPIEQSTTPRKSYGITLKLGFSFIVFINLLFAILVFLFFGLDIKDNALSNLPDGTVWVYVIKGCLVAELVFTFAVVLMPVAEALDEKVLYRLKKRYWPFILSGSVVRTLLVLIVVGIAEIFGCHFGLVMSAIGGLGPNLLGFGLPSLFYLIIMRRHYGFFTFMFNCFIISFGLFALLYNSYNVYATLSDPNTAKC